MSDSGNVGTLVRSKLWFDGGFAMIPNAWIRDPQLSPSALGVLVKLASHEAGYEVSIRGMSAGSPVGIDAIRTAVGELERAGYLKRYRRRERGRIVGTNWHLFDPHAPVDSSTQLDMPGDVLPPLAKRKPRSEPEREKPALVSPALVTPALENPTTKEDQLKEELQVVTDVTTDARGVADDFPSACHHEKFDGGRCVYACTQQHAHRLALEAASA